MHIQINGQVFEYTCDHCEKNYQIVGIEQNPNRVIRDICGECATNPFEKDDSEKE